MSGNKLVIWKKSLRNKFSESFRSFVASFHKNNNVQHDVISQANREFAIQALYYNDYLYDKQNIVLYS